MATVGLPHDALQPRPPGGLLPGAGLSLVVHAGLVVAIALGVNWQRTAQVEFSAELWSALPEVAAPRTPTPAPTPQPPAPTPAPTPAPPPPAPTRSAADIALERERAAQQERAEREERLRREREAEARRAKAAEEAALKRQRELQQQREQELARKAEAERLEKQRQDNLQRLLAQAGGGTGGPSSTGTAARDAAPSQAYAGRLIRHIKGRIVMPDIDRLPPTLEAVVEVRATATGTVLSRRLVKPSGNAAWDNAVLRAIDGASPLPRDTDGRAPGSIEITFRPVD
jgi:colicin import membrane protein